MTNLIQTPGDKRPLLEIRDLSARYADGEPVLRHVDLRVMPGEVLGLIGESGCGKTTLIRCILRMLPPGAEILSGEILYAGDKISHRKEKAFARYRGKKIAYIPQDCGAAMNDYMKIRQIFSEILGRQEEGFLFSLLEKVHLPANRELLDSYPFELSGGMKQRILMAVALGMAPEVLIADEPTSSIDAPMRREVLRALLEVKAAGNMSMLLITHNIADLTMTADHIAVMKDGRVLETGTVDEIIKDPKEPYTKALIAGAARAMGVKENGA